MICGTACRRRTEGDALVSEIARLGVVGGGQMGAGIAEVGARSGADVIVREINDEAAEASSERITKSLDKGVKAGKIAEADRDAALERLRFVTATSELADRQLVIEAASENESVKLDLFRELDSVVAGEAILASNTSSIPISKLAGVTGRPGQVLGVHFFNPVPVLHLVELVPSTLTGEDTVAAARAFATEQLGKRVIQARDRAGFIVNALLTPYLLSAIRMYENGMATAEDIDAGMVHGCAHPMGPLTLADMVGLDTLKAIADCLHEEFGEPQYAAPPLLRRMVEAGITGKKSGRGFYEY